MWYKTALRKNVMRVDLHAHIGEVDDFNNENDLNSAIRSILTSAVYKGLDVIGLVSHDGPFIGQRAQQLVQQDGIDLYVIPGEEYTANDKVSMIIFNLKDKMPANLNSEQAIQYAHQQKGFVLVINISKRHLQQLNKLRGTGNAPDAIEVYDAVMGAYKDIDTDYPTFASTAAKNSRDMDALNIYTLIARNELEGMGLLPEEYGTTYEPKYLQNSQNFPQ
jgi:hypothetical protein